MESGQFSIHGSCKTNCFQISCFSVGKTRAKDAALNAIQSPLLDIGIERATGIVWNITGGSDLTLFEVTFSPLPLSDYTSSDGWRIWDLCPLWWAKVHYLQWLNEACLRRNKWTVIILCSSNTFKQERKENRRTRQRRWTLGTKPSR